MSCGEPYGRSQRSSNNSTIMSDQASIYRRPKTARSYEVSSSTTRGTNFVTVRLYILLDVGIVATLTSPSSPGYTCVTRANGNLVGARFCPRLRTRSPTLMFRVCFFHLDNFRSCETYSFNQRSQNSVVSFWQSRQKFAGTKDRISETRFPTNGLNPRGYLVTNPVQRYCLSMHIHGLSRVFYLHDVEVLWPRLPHKAQA